MSASRGGSPVHSVFLQGYGGQVLLHAPVSAAMLSNSPHTASLPVKQAAPPPSSSFIYARLLSAMQTPARHGQPQSATGLYAPVSRQSCAPEQLSAQSSACDADCHL